MVVVVGVDVVVVGHLHAAVLPAVAAAAAVAYVAAAAAVDGV